MPTHPKRLKDFVDPKRIPGMPRPAHKPWITYCVSALMNNPDCTLLYALHRFEFVLLTVPLTHGQRQGFKSLLSRYEHEHSHIEKSLRKGGTRLAPKLSLMRAPEGQLAGADPATDPNRAPP